MGQPEEESHPPRALLYWPMIPPAVTARQLLPTFTAHSVEGHPPAEQQRPPLITRMVERAEENKEGDGSDMRALEGDWGRRPTSRRKLPEEGRLWPRYAAGDERAESDGLFKAATISVNFTRVVDMINVLTTAQINGTLEKKLRQYTLPQVLLLDELGYLPIDKRGADLLFQVVAARYECGSIVISTNQAFRDWGAIFDVNNTLATAMIDRLMHHGEAIVIRGDSYRMKDKPTE